MKMTCYENDSDNARELSCCDCVRLFVCRCICGVMVHAESCCLDGVALTENDGICKLYKPINRTNGQRKDSMRGDSCFFFLLLIDVGVW